MAEGENMDLSARLHGAALRLLRALRRADDGGSLSAQRLSALATIAGRGPLSLASLAAAEQVKPPTMSRVVEALVERGLVSRTAKEGDRRSVTIAATAAGAQLLAAGRDQRVALLAARLATLADSERRALARGVVILEQIAR